MLCVKKTNVKITVLIGYMRASKNNKEQKLDFQKDALLNFGVCESQIYEDFGSGKDMNREGWKNCFKSLRSGDILIIWKLDRLGRNIKELIEIVDSLKAKKVGLKVLTGKGASIDTTTPEGKFFFGMFAIIAEFERDILIERINAGLKSSRARGIIGGRKPSLTKHQLKFVQANVKDQKTNISELCRELKISRATLYNYVSPKGELRDLGKKVINKK